MIDNKNIKNKIKKQIMKVNNLKDLKEALEKEGFNINKFDEESFKENFRTLFELNKVSLEVIYKVLNNSEITYRAENVKEFIDYIEKIRIFENLNTKLAQMLKEIKVLIIDRVEYESDDKERVKVYGEDLTHVFEAVEDIKEKISFRMSEDEKLNLESIEKELGEEIIFSKDIEVIKKMILINENIKKENYDKGTRVRRIEIEVPKEINLNYIKAEKGSIEYYQHINSNIPRLKRLIKNLNKYIDVYNLDKGIVRINQSNLVQDTVNLAFATFNNLEFKAISGSNEVDNYCKNQKDEDMVFESYNVNRLGHLGLGYNRVNDSEKKILEEINKNIEKKLLKDEGELILYTKWEPCPSCYYVIVQFLEKHPKIKIKVKYNEKY